MLPRFRSVFCQKLTPYLSISFRRTSIKIAISIFLRWPSYRRNSESLLGFLTIVQILCYREDQSRSCFWYFSMMRVSLVFVICLHNGSYFKLSTFIASCSYLYYPHFFRNCSSSPLFIFLVRSLMALIISFFLR